MGIAEKTVKNKNNKIKRANVTILNYSKREDYITITLDIDQSIEPQMRPRVGNFKNIYDPLKKYKEILREKVTEVLANNKITIEMNENKYIESKIILTKTPPNTFSKKQKLDALIGNLKFNKKPDIDNCVKTIYDSLEGIFFFNDSQIISETFNKRYDIEGHTEICFIIYDQPKSTGRLTKKELQQYPEEIVNYINNT